MLARSSKLQHPSGITIPTPILIPSFSSKGFSYRQHGKLEIQSILEFTCEYLPKAVLFSAYDYHYEHIKLGNHSKIQLYFMDSGGYENGDDDDLSTVCATKSASNRWDKDMMKKVYNALPSDKSFVLVSYDLIGKPVSEQIQSAVELKIAYEKNLSCMLMKREKQEDKYININSVLQYCSHLKAFDIIGVTEKELGDSLLERMIFIAKLRQELDKCEVSSPIHVFGSLDPIATVLYFLSGAEIFDGLTWLRYAYANGNAVYTHNYGALEVGLDKTDIDVRGTSFIRNLKYLEDLTTQMRCYLSNGSFMNFKDHSAFFENSYKKLSFKLKGVS